MRPCHIKEYMRKSARRERRGYWNVAGLFFSMKKCPIQAKP